MASRKAVITNNEESIPTEVLAQSIADISEGMKELLSGRLNRKALLILLQASSGVGKREIEAVLDSIEGLASEYLRAAKSLKDEKRHKEKRALELDPEEFLR